MDNEVLDELEEINTELVEALEGMLEALDTSLRAAPNTEIKIGVAFKIVGAKERANKAIAKARQT